MAYIWLDSQKYPEFVRNFFNINSASREDRDACKYCVAEFKKAFEFKKTVKAILLEVSADNFFRLCLDGNVIGVGPAAAGGDFLTMGPACKHYLNEYSVSINKPRFELCALVRLLPDVLTDFSRGRGGFFARVTCIFEDNTQKIFETDSSWLSRPKMEYTDFLSYDSAKISPEACASEEITDLWQDEKAPIEMLTLSRLSPLNGIFRLSPREKRSLTLTFDKIYGAYPCVKSSGHAHLTWQSSELEGQSGAREDITIDANEEYISFRLHSLGRAQIEIENLTEGEISVCLSALATHYPVRCEGALVTSNPAYNKIYEVCRHTLKICRQTLHLDSTSHQELLACTGDYYIETLMNLFCFGDMRLSAFDVMRTSDMLAANDGRIFHTAYSLIWTLMLRDVYLFTGDKQLLVYCLEGLNKLLSRFETYLGESGLIENPPDFMFIDWTVIDGFSMHHPPKCLGQAALNAYYFAALTAASEIFAYLNMQDASRSAVEMAEKVKRAFLRDFWDSERGLFFDGKGDPCGDGSTFSPFNVNKKYFSQYPNILAACFGIVEGDEARVLLKKTVSDPTLHDIQPYFMHWELSALRKTDLFNELAPAILKRYADVVKECDKGLKEGWIAPQSDYSFDHSHAWGGTPAFQLPMALTGLKILEPGMKKLSFKFNLFNLDHAYIKIPTPQGNIEINLTRNESPQITAPEGIKIEIRA